MCPPLSLVVCIPSLFLLAHSLVLRTVLLPLGPALCALLTGQLHRTDLLAAGGGWGIGSAGLYQWGRLPVGQWGVTRGGYKERKTIIINLEMIR